jgi:hypothetical protein
MNSFGRVVSSIDETFQDRPMWLPRLRFTVRRMMVAVATLSLLLGIVIESLKLLRIRANYLSLAAVHAREIASLNLTEHKLQESRDALKVRGIGFLDPSGFLGLDSYLLRPYKRMVSFENGSSGIPGGYLTRRLIRAPSSALPRFRTLWTNSKKPR